MKANPKKNKSPRRRVSISFVGTESRTKQSFLKDADINNIMSKYTQTGVLPSGTRQARFDDFSSGVDYQTACNAILQAEEDFLSLPSSIRDRFKNDPAYFLDFMSDPANAEEVKNLLGIHSDASGEQPDLGMDPTAGNPPPKPSDPQDPASA